jgi:hypothetical protein
MVLLINQNNKMSRLVFDRAYQEAILILKDVVLVQSSTPQMDSKTLEDLQRKLNDVLEEKEKMRLEKHELQDDQGVQARYTEIRKLYSQCVRDLNWCKAPRGPADKDLSTVTGLIDHGRHVQGESLAILQSVASRTQDSLVVAREVATHLASQKHQIAGIGQQVDEVDATITIGQSLVRRITRRMSWCSCGL